MGISFLLATYTLLSNSLCSHTLNKKLIFTERSSLEKG
ncbi:hypothetical protein NEOC65_001033 [Neochlamydia sp. AcF65]|nr:hypothetical protein [Neochlamydia sp. AcF65]